MTRSRGRCTRAGAIAEAREAMRHALALGTRDAMLFYHAAVIDHALGRARSSRPRSSSERTHSIRISREEVAE